MNKIYVILLSGFLLFASYCVVFADTVILKSGKSVQGKLIESTDEYLEIDISGIPVKYWKDEIEKVERDNVVEVSKAVLGLKENTREEYSKKALDLLKEKGYEEAIANAEKAIMEDKTYLPAYTVLESAYFKLNKLKETIDISTQALNIDPDDVSSNIYIALAYKNTGQKEQARTYFSKVVSLLDRQRRPIAILVEELLKDLNYK